MICRFVSSDPRRFSGVGGREEQQDYADCWVDSKTSLGCWAMADGLGGHAGGAVASRMAVESVLAAFAEKPVLSEEALASYIAAAEKAIREKQSSDWQLREMRTTLVVLLMSQVQAVWGHVGDSRLYYFQNDKIVASTKDHSVTQAMVDAGKIKAGEIRSDPNRNRLLQSLGGNGDIRIDIAGPVAIRAGDGFLLCTDGFWEYVWENEMEEWRGKVKEPDKWLMQLENLLLGRAAGDCDNYSALAVFLRDARK